MCVNYALINKQCLDATWLLPDCASIIDRFQGGDYFLQLDLKAGFHNIPLSEAEQHYTTFVTQDGAYHFKQMPWVLKGAPLYF